MGFPYRIVAHRGSREAENSMSSIRQALAQKADIVEVDVRMTRDKGFVIMHDYFLERTTTGTGWVAAKRLAELRGIRLRNGEPIPTLDEVLAYMGKRKAGLVLDVKDMLIGHFDVKRFIAMLREHDMLHRVIASSYSPIMLHRLRRHERDLDLSLLTVSPYGIAVPIAKRLQAKYISCIMPVAKGLQARYLGRRMPTEGFLSWAREEDITPIAWWQHGRQNLEWLMRQGVTHFETDRPDVLRGELSRLRKSI